MKRVLLPIPALQWGGLFAVLEALDGPLRERGYMQSVLVPEGAEAVRDRLRDSGVDVHCTDLPRLRRSPAKSAAALVRMPASLRTLRDHPAVRQADLFQAVGVHHPHAPWLSRATRRPLVWQLHSDSVSGPFRRLARAFIARWHEGVIANGTKIGRTFLGGTFGEGNHGVFYPPIATERFAPDAAARARARGEMGLAEDETLACSIGNRGWQKNHQLMIEVLRRCAARQPKLRMVIAGADVAGYEDTYRREVLEPAEVLNREYPGLVRFIRVGPTEVPDLLRASDIFMLSSHSEGIPMVVAEAMAAGTPVISTDVGSISEILPEGAGRVVPPGVPEALAQALCDLAAAPELRDTMGATALNHATSTFSADAAADNHAAVYAKALEPVSSRTADMESDIP